MSKKIKLGILGGGQNSLIGGLHRIASAMFDQYQLVGGVFNSKYEDSITFAKSIGVPTQRVYQDLEELIACELQLPKDERMQVVSVLTPNFLHFSMVKFLLENGFHVICEKPMATTYEEAKILHKLVIESKRVFALTHTYTGYPMIRQMRDMVLSGRLGKIQKVDAQYYQ